MNGGGSGGPSLTLRVTGDDAGSAGRAGSLADASGFRAGLGSQAAGEEPEDHEDEAHEAEDRGAEAAGAVEDALGGLEAAGAVDEGDDHNERDEEPQPRDGGGGGGQQGEGDECGHQGVSVFALWRTAAGACGGGVVWWLIAEGAASCRCAHEFEWAGHQVAGPPGMGGGAHAGPQDRTSMAPGVFHAKWQESLKIVRFSFSRRGAKTQSFLHCLRLGVRPRFVGFSDGLGTSRETSQLQQMVWGPHAGP